jgi:hypothetical protein
MKFTAIALLTLISFAMVLTGCRASGEIGDTSSVVAPK